ncbi:GDA1 CD39 NTPase-like protein [Aureococcus anophagefferens]|nr:GDA1 CD39 NTPase-like protein [Aureococcus anophagefferens]
MAALVCATQARTLMESRFSVIVDAGSTGSRVYVYEKLSDVDMAGSRGAKHGPGLAQLVGSSREALAAYLRPLVDFAADRVPEAEWTRTPLRLYATAGMRLADAAAARRLYDDCFAVLSGGAFTVDRRDLRTISGEDEAFFAGLAANYAMGTVDAARKFQERQSFDLVFGALDLGGASTQIAAPIRSNRRAATAPLEAVDFETRTYLGYGIEAVAAKYDAFLESLDARLGPEAVADPCAPRGHRRPLPARGATAEGTGDFRACADSIATALGFGDCHRERRKRREAPDRESARKYALQTCGLPADAKAGGAELPPLALEPGARYVATSLYYYAWRTLQTAAPRRGRRGAPAPATADGVVAGLDGPWDAFQGDADRRRRELPRRCFELAYASLLLGDVYGVDPAANAVAVAVDVHGVELDWALGRAGAPGAGLRRAPPPRPRRGPTRRRCRRRRTTSSTAPCRAPARSSRFVVVLAVLGIFLASTAPGGRPRANSRSRTASPFPRRPSRNRFASSLGVEKCEP